MNFLPDGNLKDKIYLMDIILTRLICSFLLIANMGGAWDVWWHLTVGRESFWIPPHMVLYTGIAGSVIFGFLGYYLSREKVWRNLALILLLIPLSGPFDDFWHRWYGLERNDSIWITWSPPHVLLVLSVAISSFVLLRFIKKDPDESARIFFGSIAMAGILGNLMFLVSPLLPLDAFHLVGFYGAGFFITVYVSVLLYSQSYFSGAVRAVFPAAFFAVLISLTYHVGVGQKIIILPHPHPANWILIFSYLIPAFVVDLIKEKPLLLRGLLAGGLYGVIFYGAANIFIDPQFQYSAHNFQIAVLSSLVGGVVAALLVKIRPH